MAKVILTKSFRFSPNGYEIVEYKLGEQELEGRALEAAEAQGIVQKQEVKQPVKTAKKKTKKAD